MADDLKSVLDAMEKSYEATRKNLDLIYNTNKALIGLELIELRQASVRLGQTVAAVGEAIKRLPAEAFRQIDAATKKRFEALDKALDRISDRGSKQLAQTIVSGDFKNLGSVLKGLGKEVGSVFVEAFRGIRDDAKSILADLIQEGIVNPLRVALQEVLKEAMDVIRSVVKAGTELLSEAIRGATEWLTTGIKGVLDIAFTKLQELLTGIWDTISSAFSSLTGQGGMLSGIGGSLGGLLGDAGDWLSGLFGGGSGAGATTDVLGGFVLDDPIAYSWAMGGLAAGGPATRGMPYVVGERGPELFVPDMSGRVVSNENFRSFGGARQSVNLSYNIDARGADAGVEARIRLAMRETEARTITAVRDLANRGGDYAKALGRRRP